MDEKLQSMYKSELQLKKAAGIATGLMLIIVLLGIFGVLDAGTHQTNQGNCGAKSTWGRSSPYTFIIYPAICGTASYCESDRLAAYLLFKQPLASAISLPDRSTAGIYFMAGIFVTVIAFILISLQCLRVALANPVTSLKTE